MIQPSSTTHRSTVMMHHVIINHTCSGLMLLMHIIYVCCDDVRTVIVCGYLAGSAGFLDLLMMKSNAAVAISLAACCASD